MKKHIILFLIVVLSMSVMMGAGKEVPMKDYMAPVNTIKVGKEVRIVGLGEATHGNSELQTLKLEVFKALVEHNNCRLFAIEGDFGGCAKVNEYIIGGKGTAQEAIADIRFAIYRTKEMASLVEWMREYNQKVPENKKLKCYGFDMQRYDYNKEFLFTYLDKVDPQLSKEYSLLLSDLNDETVYNQDKEKVKTALTNIEALMKKMTASKAEFIKKTNEKEFEFALQCAQCIKENATLRGTGANYSNTRDEYMKNKVDWILNYEGNQLLFITGHNGHIEKTSTTVGLTCMGERLAKSYGKTYYAIGTDCLESTFNAVTSKGQDQVMTVKHSNPLTLKFLNATNNISFMDFSTAQKNPQLKAILNSKVAMLNIGAEFNEWQKAISSFYTLKMVPSQAYDGIIVLKKATPSTRVDSN